jgi:hypothetical protein
MNPAEREPRYEVKMLCAESAAPAVLAELRIATSGLRATYAPRVVQSIYLDTHGGRAVADNLAGVSDREKIRFRWYGEDACTVRGQLECKRRSNMLGNKLVASLAAPIEVRGVHRVAFMRALRAASPPEWRERLGAHLEPAQWIRYWRAYFATADGEVRVTVDRDLQAFDLRNAWVLRDDRPTPVPRVLIVECKAPIAQRGRIEALLQELPLQVDKCSKFILASAPAHAPIVSIPPW